jgi:hypothetical protein
MHVAPSFLANPSNVFITGPGAERPVESAQQQQITLYQT